MSCLGYEEEREEGHSGERKRSKGRAGGWVEGGGTVGRGMLFTLSTCMYGFKFRQHTGFTFIIRKKEP